MNVLVTGGAGYIGSICVEELINSGHAVTVLDNLSEGHRSAVDSRANFIEGNLGDPAIVNRVLKDSKAEAIIHFAAHALVGESMENPGKYFRNNVAWGLELLDAAVKNNVRKFVFSSTCATYGPPDRVPMTEDLPQRPINPYGESKLMFEKMLLWYQKIFGLEFVAFRYFNAAGASKRYGEHHRIETHLIPNVLKVPLGQAKQCEIYGTDVVLIGCGPLLSKAIEAGKKLADQGIKATVINNPFVNHVDLETIGPAVKAAGGRLVTIEDHQIVCGMGAQVSHALSREGISHQVKSLGMKGEFGQSAYVAEDLYKAHGLTADRMIEAARQLLGK